MEKASDDIAEAPRWTYWWSIAMWALAAFLATPFVLTGLYRITPDGAPAWELWPFVIVTAAVAAVWLMRPRWRIACAAVLLSEVVWFAALWWLLSSLSEFD